MTRDAISKKIFTARITGIYKYFDNGDIFIFEKKENKINKKLIILLSDEEIDFKHFIYKKREPIYKRELIKNIDDIWNFNIYRNDKLNEHDFIIYLKDGNETLCF